MADWDNIGSSVIGEGHGDDEVKNPVEMDWFATNHDIFDEDTDIFLVDPRDVKRAETAPSILTVFSADGTLCVGGSLEEGVPPEEEYRYTEEYHVLYYSKYPRDPRMLVPLRNGGGVKRGVETGVIGRRGITGTKRSTGEGVSASDSLPDDRNLMDGNIKGADENNQDSKEEDTKYAENLLGSIYSSQQHKVMNQKHQHEDQVYSFSNMDTGQMISNPPIESASSLTAPQMGSIQPQGIRVISPSATISKPSQQQQQQEQRQEDVTSHSLRRGGALPSSRPTLQSGNIMSQIAGTKNNVRRHVNGNDIGSTKPRITELASMREYLDEMHHDPSYEDIKGHVVYLSKDQNGSRFIQHLLEEEQNVRPIFDEVFPSTCDLIIDVFGNYVLQRLFDVTPSGSDIFDQILEKVSGRLKEYTFHMYACRVVQKFLEKASNEAREKILLELKSSMVDCVFDQNANHVAQKIIEVMPEKTEFLTEAFLPRLKSLSRHPYGCRVLQCVFEKCTPALGTNIRPLLDAVFDNVHEFVMDQYGNYVVQHALINAPEDLRKRFVELLIPHVYALSCSKFASNVAEKTIVKANEEEMQQIVENLTRPLGGSEDGNYIVLMMQDPYANYVVQRLLLQVNQQQQQHIADQTKHHLTSIRRSVYGQHLVQKMENMGMFSTGDGLMVNNVLYPEQTPAGRGSNRKIREMGGCGARRVASGPQSPPVMPVEQSSTTASPYRQPAATVAVGGRAILPPTTAGPARGYGYLGSPSDAMLAPSQSLQQQQHVISLPSVRIGAQTCFPGIVPSLSPASHHQQPQRQIFELQHHHGHHNAANIISLQQQSRQQQKRELQPQQRQQQMPASRNLSTPNPTYGGGNFNVSQVYGENWTHTYQTLDPSVQWAIPDTVNATNTYPSISPAF